MRKRGLPSDTIRDWTTGYSVDCDVYQLAESSSLAAKGDSSHSPSARQARRARLHCECWTRITTAGVRTEPQPQPPRLSLPPIGVSTSPLRGPSPIAAEISQGHEFHPINSWSFPRILALQISQLLCAMQSIHSESVGCAQSRCGAVFHKRCLHVVHAILSCCSSSVSKFRD